MMPKYNFRVIVKRKGIYISTSVEKDASDLAKYIEEKLKDIEAYVVYDLAPESKEG